MNDPSHSSAGGTKDPRIQRVLASVMDHLRRFAEDQVSQVDALVEIGVAMSAQENVEAVFEMILSHARKVTNADGGTLYLVNPERTLLEFHVVHNDTLGLHQGGTSPVEVKIPPVQLYRDGEPNHKNVSAHVAHTGEMVNIPDVYRAEGFDFSGARAFDRELAYRSVSMLTVPMRDHTHTTIGVLQLINAIDPHTNATIEFDSHHERRVMSLASLAAVMLTQQNLIDEMRRLFDSLIRALATAIDAKSDHIGNHIARVTELTMLIARAVCEADSGPLAGANYSEAELEELRIAAWLHDTGKIVTPKHVVDKSTRLETVFDRAEMLSTRWQAMKERAHREALEQLLAEAGDSISRDAAARVQHELDGMLSQMDEELAFILKLNDGGEFVTETRAERLKEIARRRYLSEDGELPALQEDEFRDLSIPRGTLNEEERKIIQDHVVQTERILHEIAWPRSMKDVPPIAASHHEMLDGSGYPKGLKGDEILLQSRIMAVADIFEALSAKDRPYKEPMKLSQTLKIIRRMVDEGCLDGDVVEVFINSGAVFAYARQHMAREQIDIDATGAAVSN